MTESDIYQIVGKAYCDGVSHGMEKSATVNVSALKSIFRAADKGRLSRLFGGNKSPFPALESMVKKVGMGGTQGTNDLRSAQLFNALTDNMRLGSTARNALISEGKFMNMF